jgi:dTDP-glucose 4,6-dehydratase
MSKTTNKFSPEIRQLAMRMVLDHESDNIHDWSYVDHHVPALRAAFERGVIDESDMIGGRSEQTNLAVVEVSCDILHRLKRRADGLRFREQISFVTDRLRHDFRYAIDALKLEHDLGWAPVESFASEIEKTIRWYLDSEGWWKPIVSGTYRSERLGAGV